MAKDNTITFGAFSALGGIGGLGLATTVFTLARGTMLPYDAGLAYVAVAGGGASTLFVAQQLRAAFERWAAGPAGETVYRERRSARRQVEGEPDQAPSITEKIMETALISSAGLRADLGRVADNVRERAGAALRTIADSSPVVWHSFRIAPVATIGAGIAITGSRLAGVAQRSLTAVRGLVPKFRGKRDKTDGYGAETEAGRRWSDYALTFGTLGQVGGVALSAVQYLATGDLSMFNSGPVVAMASTAAIAATATLAEVQYGVQRVAEISKNRVQQEARDREQEMAAQAAQKEREESYDYLPKHELSDDHGADVIMTIEPENSDTHDNPLDIIAPSRQRQGPDQVYPILQRQALEYMHERDCQLARVDNDIDDQSLHDLTLIASRDLPRLTEYLSALGAGTVAERSTLVRKMLVQPDHRAQLIQTLNATGANIELPLHFPTLDESAIAYLTEHGPNLSALDADIDDKTLYDLFLLAIRDLPETSRYLTSLGAKTDRGKAHMVKDMIASPVHRAGLIALLKRSGGSAGPVLEARSRGQVNMDGLSPKSWQMSEPVMGALRAAQKARSELRSLTDYAALDAVESGPSRPSGNNCVLTLHDESGNVCGYLAATIQTNEDGEAMTALRVTPMEDTQGRMVYASREAALDALRSGHEGKPDNKAPDRIKNESPRSLLVDVEDAEDGHPLTFLEDRGGGPFNGFQAGFVRDEADPDHTSSKRTKAFGFKSSAFAALEYDDDDMFGNVPLDGPEPEPALHSPGR